MFQEENVGGKDGSALNSSTPGRKVPPSPVALSAQRERNRTIKLQWWQAGASVTQSHSPLWFQMPRLCVECKEEAAGMVGANSLTHKSIRGDSSADIHIWKCEVLENVHAATCKLRRKTALSRWRDAQGTCPLSSRLRRLWLLFTVPDILSGKSVS